MKYHIPETGILETHHIYSLIHNYVMDNRGRKPEYLIMHPATAQKERLRVLNSEISYTVISYDGSKMYGIDILRSLDVEEDFILIV